MPPKRDTHKMQGAGFLPLEQDDGHRDNLEITGFLERDDDVLISMTEIMKKVLIAFGCGIEKSISIDFDLHCSLSGCLSVTVTESQIQLI